MKFKNKSGKWLTKSLFFDLTPKARPYAIYTFKDESHRDAHGGSYLSLKQLFLESDDPTEYKFATEHLGGWQHWKEMQTVPEILTHITEWREERDVRLQSLGVRKMIESADQGNYQAAKCLMDKGWYNQTKGRPSKEAVKKEVKAQAKLKAVVNNDLDRIRKLHG